MVTPESIAVLFSRILLGMLFIFQGYDKIFNMGINGVIQNIEPFYRRIRISNSITVLIAYLTSYIEFIGGMLLFLGIFKYLSLYALGIDLFIVSFGMSLLNPVWKMDIVIPRFILLIFLLLVPFEYERFNFQKILFN